MRKILLTSFVALAATFAAAGAFASSISPMASVSTLTVRGSDYGRILFDGRGFALYGFTKDGRGPSKCYGDCAKAWPPYLVKSRALAGAGIRRSLVGTTKRSDGRPQVTYAGRPLYYYVGDRKAGQVLCQNVPEFGGTWLVVRATGALVR